MANVLVDKRAKATNSAPKVEQVPDRRSSTQSEFSKLLADRKKSHQINEKASVFGGVQSLRQGKLPTNAQLDRVIDRLVDSRSISSNQSYMSSDGQLLLKDFKELLLVFQRALKTKNRDELFQSMIYHVKRSEEAAQRDHGNQQQLAKDAQTGAGAILKIAKLFLFNSQFRGLLEQILTIAQQSMGLAMQEGGKVISNNAKDGRTSDSQSITAHDNDDESDVDSHFVSSDGNVRPVTLASFGQPSTLRSDIDAKSVDNSNNAKNVNGPIPKEHEDFLAHRFAEYEPQLATTDDAGHTLDEDLDNGAVCHNDDNFVTASQIREQAQTDKATSPDQAFLSNRSAIQPTAQTSDSQLHDSMAAAAFDSSSNHQQGDLSNFSSTQPPAQIAKTDLRDSMAASAIKSKYANNQAFMSNTSSLQPTAQVSDTDLRNSLSNAAQRALNPLSNVYPAAQVSDDDFYDASSSFASSNGYLTNASSVHPPAQVSDSRLKSALAATRVDLGYITNLSQRSDTNLRSSLASSRGIRQQDDITTKALPAKPPKIKEYIRSSSPSSFADTGVIGVEHDDQGEFEHQQYYGNHMDVYKKSVDEDFRSASPSSFADTGAFGTNNDHGDFVHEQFYGNHMDIYKNLPQQPDVRSASPSSFADTGIIGSNNGHDEFVHEQFFGNHMDVYNKNKQDGIENARSVSPSSFAETGVIGNTDNEHGEFKHEQFYGNHMDVYSKNKQDGIENARSISPSSFAETGMIGNTDNGHSEFKHEQFYGNHMDIYNTASKLANEELRSSSPSSFADTGVIGNDTNEQTKFNHEQFFGNHMEIYERLYPPTGVTEKVVLSPKTNIGVGAGYDLQPHSVLATEIISSLRQREGGFKEDGKDQDAVSAFADNYSGDHVMDRLDATKQADVQVHSPVANRIRNSMTLGRTAANQYEGNAEYNAPVLSSHGLSTFSNGFSDEKSKQPGMSEIEQYHDCLNMNDEDFNEKEISGGQSFNKQVESRQENEDMASEDIDSGDKEQAAEHSKGHNFSAFKVVNKVKGKGKSKAINEAKEEDSVSTDELISKLKEIVTSIQKNPEYQEAISTLFSLFGVWGQKMKNGTGGMDRRRSSAVDVPEQAEYYRNIATFEAKTIIEDWAQGKSLDPILQQFYHISNKLKHDDDLRKLSDKVLGYVKKLLSDGHYLNSENSTKDGSKLIKEIRGSAIEEYKPQVRKMFQQSNDIIQAMSDDKTSQELSSKIKDIHDHLWYDSDGNPTFKPQLINDIRITLLPALIEQIKYIPLPQILYADKQYDIALENLVFEGDTLMPDIFEIRGDEFIRFSSDIRKDVTNSQAVNIHMSGIHATMNDVIFYYKRKSGFPRMSDAGVLSLTTGGAGLRISLRITHNNSFDQQHPFKVEQCHAHIDKLDIKVRSCKHNMLYKVFNPVLTGIIKRQIVKGIEGIIKKQMMNAIENKMVYLWMDPTKLSKILASH